MHQAQQQFIFSLPSNTEILHVSEGIGLWKTGYAQYDCSFIGKTIIKPLYFYYPNRTELTTSLYFHSLFRNLRALICM